MADEPVDHTITESTTTTVASTIPETVAAVSSHVWPLLIFGIAILVSVVVMVLYGHEPDKTLYDLLLSIGGAIAGVTWSRR